jgi:hypothetical protein
MDLLNKCPVIGYVVPHSIYQTDIIVNQNSRYPL